MGVPGILNYGGAKASGWIHTTSGVSNLWFKKNTINQIITRWFLAITGRRWYGTGVCYVDNSEVSDANIAEHRDLPEPANARV